MEEDGIKFEAAPRKNMNRLMSPLNVIISSTEASLNPNGEH